jgi:hypothetical protein
VEYGFTFVDLTEKRVARYTGRDADTGDNEWPWRLYKLRRQVEQIVNAERQQDWTARLNDYAQDFSAGKRFLMGWRLGGMESDLAASLERQGTAVPAASPPATVAPSEAQEPVPAF